MRPLRYSINVTLDGCVHHNSIVPDEELHRHAARTLEWADAFLFGRVTYQMMEDAWRAPAESGVRADWMEEYMMDFARTIHAGRKYVVSSTLPEVTWNAELVRGNLGAAVRALKAQPGRGILVGGVTLPLALVELGLIDEYEILVHPRIVGPGPRLFEGLSRPVDLKLVERHELRSGAVVLNYEAVR